MTPELEALQSVGTAVSAIGLPTTIIIVLFALYRFERLKVEVLQAQQIELIKALTQQRIDDYKLWLSILNERSFSSRTPTNLGG